MGSRMLPVVSEVIVLLITNCCSFIHVCFYCRENEQILILFKLFHICFLFLRILIWVNIVYVWEF